MTRAGMKLVEFTGDVYRRCANCHEPNPSYVQCPACDTWNESGKPCRHCRGPGGLPTDFWSHCPKCGTKGVVEKNRVYFNESRWRMILHIIMEKVKQWTSRIRFTA